MRERFRQFMYGRYGMDQLNRFLSIAALIVLVLAMVLRLPRLDVIPLILLVICYCRMFSRNIPRRYAENAKFLSVTSRITGRFRGGNPYQYQKKRTDYRAYREQRKIYRFFVCPGCGQKVRVPRGKGKICITCPKCRTEFIKRT